MRVCDVCGKPMREGYYLDGDYACSDECALVIFDGDKALMDETLSHADEDDCEFYWTEWEEDF